VLRRRDAGSGGSGGLTIAGRHLHHYNLGIALLTGVGGIAVHGQAPRRRHPLTAAAYGAGAALILDELALLIDLQDVYWAKKAAPASTPPSEPSPSAASTSPVSRSGTAPPARSPAPAPEHLPASDRPLREESLVWMLGAGKVLAVLDVPAAGGETLGFWIEAYLTAAMRGVRSAEVAGKIARHLGRFRDWSLAGFGHDRIAAVTAREVTGWREHLAGTAVRTLADGRVQVMAPATVNNHLAHLSALFTWTLVHAPSGLLVHGDPTKGVELLPLPAPQPRALTDAQVRTVKNVLDRLEGFHRLKGRRHQRTDARPARHAHARPVRPRPPPGPSGWACSCCRGYW